MSDAVREASLRSDVKDAVNALYLQLQNEIEIRKPLCQLSGRCCRFEEYGHRLFVTTMELGAFLSQLHPELLNKQVEKGCPFQVGKMCGVHSIRPFGCRMFFCDETATEWQQQKYEEFHARLKRLHEELNVPYFYMEWRQALAAIGFDSPAAAVVK